MFTRTRMMAASGAGGVANIALTIASDTLDYNLFSNVGSGYEAGNSIITLTINSGIYLGSSSTSTAGLIIPSSFHTDDQIFIINNGFIVGRGGNGGNGAGGGYNNATAGGTGGTAISASFATNITNNGTVAGGGGGGGGAGYYLECTSFAFGSCQAATQHRGNGGGGGQGLNGGSGGLAQQGTGGTNGSAGSKSAAGAGGTASYSQTYGGNGGALGASGSAGAAGGINLKPGGAAGKYATGNSNITWATTGTRLGGVS